MKFEDKYRTDYKAVEWSGPEELCDALNREVNGGWRVDVHILHEHGRSGTVIFSKTVVLDLDPHERIIKLREVFRILDSTEIAIIAGYDEKATEVIHAISKKVQEESGVTL